MPLLSRVVGFRWLLLTLLAGCAGSPGPSAASTPTFPPYTWEAAALFDDQIEPKAVGLADVGIRPQLDPVLRARVRAAEAVTRVRVATVTADSSGGKPTYRINLVLSGESFVRRGLTDDHVEILVRGDSPAFNTVKWLDARLIGRTFIGFFHRYAGSDDVELRFHLSSDDPDEAGAIREAATLGEITGK